MCKRKTTEILEDRAKDSDSDQKHVRMTFWESIVPRKDIV